MFFVLLILVGGPGVAAWYFLLGPGATASSGPAASTPETPARATPDTMTAATPAPVDSSPVAPAPTLVPTVTPPGILPPAVVGTIDRLSDTMIVAIRSYEERSRLYEGGLADCTVLARGLLAVEGAWTRYEGAKRQLTVQLDATRSQRDLQLFASVDSASAHYDRSGCRRP